MSVLSEDNTPKLTEESAYNATVESVRRVHDELIVLRVVPDGGVPHFQPGQYTTLGLYSSELRVDFDTADAQPPLPENRLIRRAYSISCPILDDDDRLVTCSDCGFLEFYVTLVPHSLTEPLSLTPRLFALQAGQRIAIGRRITGRYTLDPINSNSDIIFAATGTGEAPHNAMTAHLLANGHTGRIASFVSVRYARDLAYESQHRKLEHRFANYRYLPVTTRESINVDESHSDYVGRKHLQDYFATDELEHRLGWMPEPEGTHVFLCGHPNMIGISKSIGDHEAPQVAPNGVIQVLTRRGFQVDQPGKSGNVHFEKYW